MSADREVQRFLRAAFQRLETAFFLFENRRFIDAIYLGGYAPECALKALILSQVPTRSRGAFVDEHFRSAKAHDFEFLKALLKKRGHTIPLASIADFRITNAWSTDLRYDVGIGRERDARAFLSAARRIVEWVKRSR